MPWSEFQRRTLPTVSIKLPLRNVSNRWRKYSVKLLFHAISLGPGILSGIKWNCLNKGMVRLLYLFIRIMISLTDPGGRTVQYVGLRPLACWDCGFESRRGHGCLSVVNVVCSTGRGLCDRRPATGRSLIQGSPAECVIECDQVQP